LPCGAAFCGGASDCWDRAAVAAQTRARISRRWTAVSMAQVSRRNSTPRKTGRPFRILSLLLTHCSWGAPSVTVFRHGWAAGVSTERFWLGETLPQHPQRTRMDWTPAPTIKTGRTWATRPLVCTIPASAKSIFNA